MESASFDLDSNQESVPDSEVLKASEIETNLSSSASASGESFDDVSSDEICDNIKSEQQLTIPSCEVGVSPPIRRLFRSIFRGKDNILETVPCPCKQFTNQLAATRDLDDTFYIPRRAELILQILKRHGHHSFSTKPRPRFRTALQLVQHVLSRQEP